MAQIWFGAGSLSFPCTARPTHRDRKESKGKLQWERCVEGENVLVEDETSPPCHIPRFRLLCTDEARRNPLRAINIHPKVQCHAGRISYCRSIILSTGLYHLDIPQYSQPNAS